MLDEKAKRMAHGVEPQFLIHRPAKAGFPLRCNKVVLLT